MAHNLTPPKRFIRSHEQWLDMIFDEINQRDPTLLRQVVDKIQQSIMYKYDIRCADILLEAE